MGAIKRLVEEFSEKVYPNDFDAQDQLMQLAFSGFFIKAGFTLEDFLYAVNNDVQPANCQTFNINTDPATRAAALLHAARCPTCKKKAHDRSQGSPACSGRGEETSGPVGREG